MESLQSYLESKIDSTNTQRQYSITNTQKGIYQILSTQKVDKCEKRAKYIISHINNNKKSQKFQTIGYRDAKIIKRYCDDNNIKCDITEETMQRNVVDYISPSDAVPCGTCCGYGARIIEKKVNCVYVIIN